MKTLCQFIHHPGAKGINYPLVGDNIALRKVVTEALHRHSIRITELRTLPVIGTMLHQRMQQTVQPYPSGLPNPEPLLQVLFTHPMLQRLAWRTNV
ncbi:hypothetical protein [Epibacterium ulvae]|uniref:hypothetical protein n=1 Tax=Epibacterium ulvae TaxID=1156985 RepID=UPI00248FDFFA|nr:hypothetical protein [Epibacterium ulvae]